MKKCQLLAVLLGLLLVSVPLIRANSEEDEYEDSDEEAAGGADVSSEKDVVVLTKANFEEKVKKSKFALVEFYAPWCGHCKKLAPEYAKAATTVKEYDADIVIAKLDATEEKDLASEFEVQGYPTIKWFVDGEVASDYSGPRDAAGIANWIKKKTGPAADTVDDKKALSKTEEENEVVIVGYFKELKGTEYDIFIKLAQMSEDGTFVQTTSAEVAKAAGLSSAPGAAVITNFPGEDRSTIPLKGKFAGEALTDLVATEKMPPTIEFNDANSQKIFGAGIEKQLLLIAKSSDLKKGSKVFSAYRSAALQFKGKVVFVLVDLDGTSKDPVVNFFGVQEDEAPIIVGFHMGKNKKFRFKEKISEKTVKAFAQGLLDDTLVPDFKSAPIPEGADAKDGEVVIIVGKNFDSVVKDSSKDVLLEVYAPWCGHCKALEPVYKKLAKRFKKIDSVVIAKMDGTENEHPDVEVKGFPTILFFPAGDSKAAVSFDGSDRSLKALTKFIKKNANTKFELPKKAKEEEEEESEPEPEVASDDIVSEEEFEAEKEEL